MKGPNWYLKMLGVSAAGALCLGYAYFQTLRVLHGATLSITKPQQGATFSKPFISVEGQARRAAFISVNDREILTDESGRFAEEVLLAQGYNVVTVRMRDRFGAVREKKREVVYKKE